MPPAHPDQTPQRVVVFAPNWLGDAVMALPAVADLRRRFPTSTLGVAARASIAPLFESITHVDTIVTLTGSLRADAAAIRARGFELAILLPNSFRSAWLARRARVPERWGYRTDARALLLTRSVRRPRRLAHEAAYHQYLLQALGVPTGPLEPSIDVSTTLQNRARALLIERGCKVERPLIALAPGAAFGRAKRWPLAHVAELVCRLLGDVDADCVLLGSSSDRPAGGEIEAGLARCGGPTTHRMGSYVNLIGETDVPLLLGVLSWCQVIVANDSGPLHAAAAIGVPAVAIFGPTDERGARPLNRSSALPGAREVLLGPAPSAVLDRHLVIARADFCRPCFLRECPIDHRCMRRIPAVEVLEAVTRQLDRWARRPASAPAQAIS